MGSLGAEGDPFAPVAAFGSANRLWSSEPQAAAMRTSDEQPRRRRTRDIILRSARAGVQIERQLDHGENGRVIAFPSGGAVAILRDRDLSARRMHAAMREWPVR